MSKRYRYSSGVIYRQIRYLFKDLDRGALDREQTAARLHLLADKLNAYSDEFEQISLFDIQERVKKHVQRTQRPKDNVVRRWRSG